MDENLISKPGRRITDGTRQEMRVKRVTINFHRRNGTEISGSSEWGLSVLGSTDIAFFCFYYYLLDWRKTELFLCTIRVGRLVIDGEGAL